MSNRWVNVRQRFNCCSSPGRQMDCMPLLMNGWFSSVCGLLRHSSNQFSVLFSISWIYFNFPSDYVMVIEILLASPWCDGHSSWLNIHPNFRVTFDNSCSAALSTFSQPLFSLSIIAELDYVPEYNIPRIFWRHNPYERRFGLVFAVQMSNRILDNVSNWMNFNF